MPRRIAHSMGQAALDAGEAVMNSAVTVTARLPIMAGGVFGPNAASVAEWNEAVSEKMQAGVESAAALFAGWNALVVGTLLSPRTPIGFVLDSLALYQSATQPALVRVRANAQRFRDPR